MLLLFALYFVPCSKSQRLGSWLRDANAQPARLVLAAAIAPLSQGGLQPVKLFIQLPVKTAVMRTSKRLSVSKLTISFVMLLHLIVFVLCAFVVTTTVLLSSTSLRFVGAHVSSQHSEKFEVHHRNRILNLVTMRKVERSDALFPRFEAKAENTYPDQPACGPAVKASRSSRRPCNVQCRTRLRQV